MLQIGFKVSALAGFLSHSETMCFFERAAVRAGLPLRYSQGFNPRPRISLPLPRSVGVQSDAELFCVEVEGGTELDCQNLKDRLAAQMADGFVLDSVKITESKKTPQPVSVSYRFTLKEDFPVAGLSVQINELLASDTAIGTRVAKKNGRTRHVDVRGFIDSIELSDRCVTVKCNVSPFGTIRIDEIQALIGLPTEQLAEPVRRVEVVWK